MKQVEVTIMGQGYVLGCPDGGEALLSAAVACDSLVWRAAVRAAVARHRAGIHRGRINRLAQD